MPEKSRIKSLSTRFLLLFKAVVYLFYFSVFLVILYFAFFMERGVFGFVNAVLYGYLLFRLVDILGKIKNIEFDDDYLYVIRRNADMLIPLENIESVEIKTIGGVYQVNLYRDDLIGKKFYFKPSLIYPLNFGAKDELVKLLRQKIHLAKQKHRTFQSDALTS